jgi:hypothetical protein
MPGRVAGSLDAAEQVKQHATVPGLRKPEFHIDDGEFTVSFFRSDLVFYFS